MKYFIFIVLSLVFSSSAFAALTTVPLREVWALATDDVVSVNASTRIATASAYVPNAAGTIYRIKATTTGVRLLTAVEAGVEGGRLNPWITGALVAANLTYVGYQWYKERESIEQVAVGSCLDPGGSSTPIGTDVTLGDCSAAAIAKLIAAESVWPMSSPSVIVKDMDTTNPDDVFIHILNKYKYFSYDQGGIYDYHWRKTGTADVVQKEKEPISDDEATSEILSSLSGASSRQAFSDGSQPYPLDGLFADSDLSVDPTYAPQADITTDNINDFIDKYNTGSLQTSDPSANNYVTPSQYQYIKSQAEQAAATAAGGSTSTNPLEGMEQPITQKQYDESNLKTVEAEAAALTATKPALQTVLDKFNADKQFMVDQMAKPTAPPVAMPNFFGWAWPTGSCSGFELDFNIHVPFIGVLSIHKVVNEYCKPYTDYVHPVFFWFFNLSTLFYIFRLWDRTAIDVAKI